MENKTEFWQNKTFLGKGTLKDFQRDYEELGNVDGQFPVASNLFENESEIIVGAANQFTKTFEYVIFYKKAPKKKDEGRQDMTSEEIDALEKVHQKKELELVM